ncbi:Cytochrome c, mono-and diheme variants [Jannaschia faecimaris]|uniref:Cytochrome c, mono-and diheme variants n=1 Tax=Jannaschia faecimaris TaxID=1244108 RepID=A0A1H3P4D8_9RHOB|nr:cytochrome c [Jannaschia faecimaris]SDY95938.1 Cytochrome c, mono-and diheme variants [Jannaschia faecimaris]
MRRFAIIIGLLGAISLPAGLWLTAPTRISEDVFAALTGDAIAGETVFHAAGCAACHAAPGAEGEARLILSGGQRFVTDFGTFLAPNVSPHPTAGIGAWTMQDFANATQRGVSPDGAHYYPVFPYAAYTLADPQDIADLWAYWQSLPPSDAASASHDLGFPFAIRRGLGLWKALYMPNAFSPAIEGDSEVLRGQYLVQALGHCAECHTPRDALGGLDRDRWLAGAPNPSGKGTIPALTPDRMTWSAQEIAAYLTDGFTPDYDSTGGSMVEVIANTAQLAETDRAAIAAYLKALPSPKSAQP